MLKKLFRTSEAWIGALGLLVQVLPVGEELKQQVVVPVVTYIIARISGKGARAVIPEK